MHYIRTDSTGGEPDPQALGRKGANLITINRAGINTPEFFVLECGISKLYKEYTQIPEDFLSELWAAINTIEYRTGKTFGKGPNPLLLSARSGSAASMPGMLESVLNIGINEEVIEAISKLWGEATALDTLIRFWKAYGSIVLQIPRNIFPHYDRDASIEQLKNTAKQYESILKLHDPKESYKNVQNQLELSIKAVVNSWDCDKAANYRKLNQINAELGTAVIVQEMVLGNANNKSCSGVMFSRNPNDGSKELYGEFLRQAQGDNVVSGQDYPHSISDATHGLKTTMPDIYRQLSKIASELEKRFGRVQEIEFTVQNDRLYILQTRNAEISAAAEVNAAVDMANEGLISKEKALTNVRAQSIKNLLHSSIDYAANPFIIGAGLPTSPGAATGLVVFSAAEAQILSKQVPVILVRKDTSPEDIMGLHFSQGLLTSHGGTSSHAALIARGINKPCITGAKFTIDEINHSFTINGTTVTSQDWISIDGTTGYIIKGKIELRPQNQNTKLGILIGWAEEIARMKVKATAEAKEDIERAMELGAMGIGLCRTEHMLFSPEKLNMLRAAILLKPGEKRSAYVRELAKAHKQDLKNIFGAVKHGISIRLFDPPLHEFISLANVESVAHELKISITEAYGKIEELLETNPMLGNRGIRLGITSPELYQMQIEAIMEAAIETKLTASANLEILIPFISCINELKHAVNTIKQVAKNLSQTYYQSLRYKIGAMIEIPRAAVIADKIAQEVDFVTFGTNDLTQMTYGISRDDFNKLSKVYEEKEIMTNPFASIDQNGVGELMRIACEKIRKAKNFFSIGACGEHSSDVKSVQFFEELNLEYISCSAPNVLVAKLAAAQATINLKEELKAQAG